MRYVVLFVIILLCTACGHKTAESPSGASTPTPFSGWSDDILTLNGVFVDQRDVVFLEVVGDRVSFECPVLGDLELIIVPQAPEYAMKATWRARIDDVYIFQLSIDVDGRMFVHVSDFDPEPGESNTIGWRFDPWAG